jgi:choline dehydrogenase-like flavoprotein
MPNTLDPSTHTRTYAASAYYLPNAGRENFRVVVSTLVTHVVLEKTASGEFEATGVEVLSAGRKFVIKAKKEVILSSRSVKYCQT